MQNPELAGPGQPPIPMPGEQFILSRTGIHFTAKSGSTKFDARGDLYLSTLRVVFVGSPRSSISGFDMPLATMQNEKFNQPIFGANNMTGVSPPLEGGGLTEDIKWCLSFKDGGVGTFLPLFFRLLMEMRSRMAAPANYAHTEQAAIPQVVAQQIVGAAYVDPSDPTKLYVSQ